MHDITRPLLQPLGMGTLETVTKGTEYLEEGVGVRGGQTVEKKKIKRLQKAKKKTKNLYSSSRGLLEGLRRVICCRKMFP